MTNAEVINRLVERYRSRSYLEIGCGDDATFGAVACDHKVGVDPFQGGTLRTTSDVYFAMCRERFDIVFVDGRHLAEQVERDITHALGTLHDDGLVVVHDTLPQEERQQHRIPPGGPWTGDVWKAVVRMRTRDDLDIATLNDQWGFSVVLPRFNTRRLTDVADDELTWPGYALHRHEWLRTMSWKALTQFLPLP